MGNPLAQLRNSEEENLQVKAGETPIEWNQQENKSVKEGALIAVNIESRIYEKRIKKSSSHCRTKSFEHRKI